MQELDALCAAVVMYCHSSTSVQAQFLFRAQDRNMTNGDFAWFTFRPVRTWRSDRPWDWYGQYVDDPAELPRRRRAFHTVKQVRRSSMGINTFYLTYLLVFAGRRSHILRHHQSNK